MKTGKGGAEGVEQRRYCFPLCFFFSFCLLCLAIGLETVEILGLYEMADMGVMVLGATKDLLFFVLFGGFLMGSFS